MKQTKVLLTALLSIAVFAAIVVGVERGWMGWKGIFRAQLLDSGENLLLNGGMEGACAVISGGDEMPPSWERYGTIGGRTCDTTEKHGGAVSWKITSQGAQYGFSEQIPVTPGTWYKGGAWVKGLRGNEYTMISLWEYDANMQRIRTPSFPLYLFAPTEWTSAAAMLRTSSGTSFVRVLLAANYRAAGVTWLDDVSLVRLPDGPNAVFLPTGPLDGADAKSIDFGIDTVMSEGTSYTADVLGPGGSTGSTAFQPLLPTKRLEVRFPAFNVDSEGLLQTPLLLEVRYRDTLDEALSTSATNHRASVSARVDFIPDDPLVGRAQWWKAAPLGLGRNGDGAWRVEQAVFSASPFSLLRARDGMFSLSISMPNIIPADASLELPLDYITLRAITQEEQELFLKESRERLGFYEIPLPEDRSGETFTEPYVIFKRDEMAMVYRHTQPSKDEVVDALSAYSVPGEIEPLSFGLYAQENVSNLTFTITDLRREDGVTIPSSALSLRKVTYDVKQAREYPRRGSALMPDRLEPFTSLTVPAGTTALLWMHVNVPPDAAPGTYRGEVRVSDGRTLPLRFTVLPLALDRSSAINAVYHDPFLKPISWNTGESFRFYREYGLDPFFYDGSIAPIKDAQGVVTGFDTTLLEQRLDRMVAEGFLEDRAVFQPYNWSVIYSALPAAPAGMSLWDRLSRPEFVAAFGMYIRKVMELGEARGVQWHFSVADEPGVNPELRITCDRLYTIIRANGGKTTVTSYSTLARELSGSLLGTYQVPGGVVPSLFPLLDVPVLAMRHADYGSRIDGEKGYYTTYFSNVRHPVYNRFLHGFGAFGFDASIISSYAMADSIADHFNDFDVNPLREFTLYPDFILAYPTWSGELLPLLAAEGIREGIKDARYIATLQRLIWEHPDHPAASAAAALLDGMRARITTDPYSHTSAIRQDGYYEEVFKDVSPVEDPGDSRAFTTVRRQLAASVLQLRDDPWLTEKVPVPPVTSSTAPSYTFHSAFDGTITYGGSCTSVTAHAVSGDNTVIFTDLAEGAHNDCTVTVTDEEGLATDTLAVSGFRVEADDSIPVTLDITAAHGTVTKSPDQPTYTRGAAVTLTATPDSGYTFVGWSGDRGGAANPVMIIMDGDKSVTALFQTDGEGEGSSSSATSTSSGNRSSSSGSGESGSESREGNSPAGDLGERSTGSGGGGGGGGGGRRGTITYLLQSFLDIGGGMVQQAGEAVQHAGASVRSFSTKARVTFVNSVPLVVRQGGFMVFLDISATSPVASDVRYMAARGVISGFRSEEGLFLRLFKPSQILRYSEAAKIVVGAANIPLPSRAEPATLSARDHWSQAYVAALEAQGSPVFTDPDLDVDTPIPRSALLRMILVGFGVRRDAARMSDEQVLAFANDRGWMTSVPFHLTSSPQAPLRRRDVLGIVRKVMEEYGEEETVHAAAPGDSLIRRLLDRLGWGRN